MWTKARFLSSHGSMETLDALIRAKAKIVIGMKLKKHWDQTDDAEAGDYTAQIISITKIRSTIDPGTEVDGYKIKYDADGVEEDLEEEEVRPLLTDVTMSPTRMEITNMIHAGYTYLEDRLTGNCQANYSHVANFELFKLVRVFDPVMANQLGVDAEYIDSMQSIECLAANNVLVGMKEELPQYIVAIQDAPIIMRDDIGAYTEKVLKWWRDHGTKFPSWSLAARIIFALSPNSAGCERVFSMLKFMFSDDQESLRSDALEVGLKLRYNKRNVG